MANANNETIIEIVACKPIYSSFNTKGDRYSVYEVQARNTQGQLINAPLRAFEQLPIGDKIEVTVSPFDSTEWGRSYTLHPKRATGAATTAEMQDMADYVKRLGDAYDALAKKVHELTQIVNQLMSDRV